MLSLFFLKIQTIQLTHIAVDRGLIILRFGFRTLQSKVVASVHLDKDLRAILSIFGDLVPMTTTQSFLI